jgi:hypothetical protein
LQNTNTNGSGGSDRYIKRGRLGERPLQEKGGGYDGGRYRGRAAVVVIGGRYRKRAAVVTVQKASVTENRYRKRAAAMVAAVTQTMP